MIRQPMSLRSINATLKNAEARMNGNALPRLIGLLCVMRGALQRCRPTQVEIHASHMEFLDRFGAVTPGSVDRFIDMDPAILDAPIDPIDAFEWMEL